MNRRGAVHIRRAAKLVAAVLGVEMLLGWAFGTVMGIPAWHGIYCGVADAATIGCDVNPSPHRPLGYLVVGGIAIVLIPLWTAVFSFVTAWLTAGSTHQIVHDATTGIKEHITSTLNPPAT